MRTIKQGVLPEPAVPWQTTTLFACTRCGHTWYADRGEWREIHSWHASYLDTPDAGCAGMDCPTCGKPCTVREPGKPVLR